MSDTEKTIYYWNPIYPSPKTLNGLLSELMLSGTFHSWKQQQGLTHDHPVHLKVDLTKWPHSFVEDFQSRLQDVLVLSGFVTIDITTGPALCEYTDAQLLNEVARIGDQLSSPEVWVVNNRVGLLNSAQLHAVTAEMQKRIPTKV